MKTKCWECKYSKEHINNFILKYGNVFCANPNSDMFGNVLKIWEGCDYGKTRFKVKFNRWRNRKYLKKGE